MVSPILRLSNKLHPYSLPMMILAVDHGFIVEKILMRIFYKHFVINLKEKVEFWEEVKIICERYHSYYASVEEHQIRHVP